MIEAIIRELNYFGVVAVFKHIIANITDDKDKWEEYWLAKQAACERLSLEQIKQITGATFKKVKGMDMHWDNPQTFDEKIRWCMLYDATPLKTKLVDKYLVQDYVREKIGDGYVIKLLGVWNSFDEIDFTKLPNQFVLKLNNGSGMNIVVKDKATFNFQEAKKRFKHWMKLNYAYVGYEMQYRDVPQKIIAEQYVEQMDGNLYDYKIHCTDGKAYCCQVIGDRDLKKGTAKQAFFDKNWNKLNIVLGKYDEYDVPPNKPNNWDEMVQIAEMLSKGFCYVRIDLYSLGDKILFSEFTFTPAMGLHPRLKPQELDIEWGNMIKLPEPYHLEIPKKTKDE